MPSRIVFLGLDGSVITALLSNCFLSRYGIANGYEGPRLQLMNEKNEIRSVEMARRIRDGALRASPWSQKTIPAYAKTSVGQPR